MRSETVEASNTVGESGTRPDQAPGRAGVEGDSGEDPRVAALGTAVAELRAALDAYPAELRDRGVAEDELDAFAAMARSGAPDVPTLRQCLLLITAALGSVSALAQPLAALRRAVELFGGPPRV